MALDFRPVVPLEHEQYCDGWACAACSAVPLTFEEWLEGMREIDALLLASSVWLDSATGTITVIVPSGTAAEEIEGVRVRMAEHVPDLATLKIARALPRSLAEIKAEQIRELTAAGCTTFWTGPAEKSEAEQAAELQALWDAEQAKKADRSAVTLRVAESDREARAADLMAGDRLFFETTAPPFVHAPIPPCSLGFAVLDHPPLTPRLRHDPVAHAEETRRCLERADEWGYQEWLVQKAEEQAQAKRVQLARALGDVLADALFGWLGSPASDDDADPMWWLS